MSVLYFIIINNFQSNFFDQKRYSQGEEIGMVDHKNITWEQTRDSRALKKNKDDYQLYTRDPSRTPFQWDDTISAGFSVATETWLPVNPNYISVNLEAQLLNPHSHVEIYKKLVKLRQTETFMYGDIMITTLDTYCFAYARFLENHDTYIVFINLDEFPVRENLQGFAGLVPEKIKVELAQDGSALEEG